MQPLPVLDRNNSLLQQVERRQPGGFSISGSLTVYMCGLQQVERRQPGGF